jgi:hypothetical protein
MIEQGNSDAEKARRIHEKKFRAILLQHARKKDIDYTEVIN